MPGGAASAVSIGGESSPAMPLGQNRDAGSVDEHSHVQRAAKLPLDVVHQLDGHQRIESIDGQRLTRYRSRWAQAPAAGRANRKANRPWPPESPAVPAAAHSRRQRPVSTDPLPAGDFQSSMNSNWPAVNRWRQVGALALAAGRAGDAAGANQADRVEPDFVFDRHGLTDGADHAGGIERANRLAAHFVNQQDLFFAAGVERKGYAAACLQIGVARLGRQLDILRIVIASTDDDQVLDSAGNEQLPLAEAT